ncbi:60Kd inner membrane protein-domain-containing protein [Coniella lustricola]|uniref:60Kd inner membrane protein-domain-containing protein n=1 Tax=Coniella lustricola TaxID=2025994 RepID=A0A2T2ZV11_9PEZI|nr:60Kd inner membrane protein-domain-containing protein [Coniella lustricola]
MLPSRGLAQASRGLAFQRQLSSRQFSTSLRLSGRPASSAPLTSSAGLLSSRSRLLGATTVASSQAFLLGPSRRFASTNAAPPTPAAPTAEGVSPDFSAFANNFDDAALLDIPERVGYLSELGLDYGWGPTSMCQWIVEHLHFTSGLPWWAAIVGGALVIRAGMAYPALLAQFESKKAREMREDPLYKATQQRQMVALATRSLSPAETMELRVQLNMIKKQYDVKMWKMFFPMLQFPFAIGMFKLTRGMAALPVPGFESAGILWFTDLSMPDPLYILPCIGAVTMVLSMQRALPFMSTDQARMMSKVPWVIGPIGILVTLNMASSVQLYLAAAAMLQYIQTLLWHIPLLRRLCGLPPLDEMVVNPNYQKSSSSSSSSSNFYSTSSKGGAQYQAPRTIDTTATIIDSNGASQQSPRSRPQQQQAPQQSQNPKFENPLDFIRDMRKKVTEAVADVQSKTGGKNEKKASDNYERRRLKEEAEKYWARIEEQKWRMEQKKRSRKP